MKTKVAINGFGRIGRAFFRLSKESKEIEVVAINDLVDVENMAYLLKYDTVYGRSGFDISVSGDSLIVDGQKISYLQEKEPSKLPWKDMDIGVVVESTGAFASYVKARPHIEAGAKRVVVSAPVKDEPQPDIAGATVLMGINEDSLKTCQISSNASCTTNAGSPVLQILKETVGVEKAMLNTVHGYTVSQSIVDGPNKKDWRRGRAGAQNIVPSTTGATVATTKAIKDLEGSFDGIAVRVPVITGSIADITFISKRDTSADEVNEIFKKASGEERWRGILATTDEALVSSDIVGNTHASIVDLNFTKVVGGNLVKVLSWYDNEMGYANTLVSHVAKAGQFLK